MTAAKLNWLLLATLVSGCAGPLRIGAYGFDVSDDWRHVRVNVVAHNESKVPAQVQLAQVRLRTHGEHAVDYPPIAVGPADGDDCAMRHRAIVPVTLPPHSVWYGMLCFDIDPRSAVSAQSIELVAHRHAVLRVRGPKRAQTVKPPEGAALTLLLRVDPDYPRPALERRAQGFVRMRLGVDAAGRVAEVKVLESVPPGLFDASAVRAVKQWRFARAAGAAPDETLVETNLRMEFRLGMEPSEFVMDSLYVVR